MLDFNPTLLAQICAALDLDYTIVYALPEVTEGEGAQEQIRVTNRNVAGSRPCPFVTFVFDTLDNLTDIRSGEEEEDDDYECHLREDGN